MQKRCRIVNLFLDWKKYPLAPLRLETRAWLVLWTATAVNFLAGLLYIWSVVGKALIVDYHWTGKQASLPYTTATVALVVSMALFGRLQDAIGPRVCCTLAGLLIGFGLILSGFSTDPIAMTLTFGVLVGAGCGIVNSCTTPPAMKWFPAHKKGMITGIVVAGIALASIVYSPLIAYLIARYGLSTAYISLGIGILILTVAFAQLLSNPPAGYIPPVGAAPAQGGALLRHGEDKDWKAMIKTADFYKLWVMLAFSSSAGLMIIGHTANIAKTQVHWEKGFLLLILLALFNAGGRFLGGTLSDKIGRIHLMRIIFIGQALNMLLFSRYLSVPSLGVGVAVTGLCYGAIFSVFPATTADKFGIRNFGADYGIVFTAWGLGGVIGPMTAAAFLDATKSYNAAYWVACALLVVATLITFTFKTPIPKSEY
jgi:MFS family permease